MRANSEWKNALQQKADEKNVTLDEMIQSDAEYVLYGDLDKYFPELAGDSVPTIRNKKIREIVAIQDQYKDIPQLASIIRSIYLSPSWLQAIKEKSDTSALSFEDFIKREASWVYENR